MSFPEFTRLLGSSDLVFSGREACQNCFSHSWYCHGLTGRPCRNCDKPYGEGCVEQNGTPRSLVSQSRVRREKGSRPPRKRAKTDRSPPVPTTSSSSAQPPINEELKTSENLSRFHWTTGKPRHMTQKMAVLQANVTRLKKDMARVMQNLATTNTDVASMYECLTEIFAVTVDQVREDESDENFKGVWGSDGEDDEGDNRVHESAISVY